MRIESKALEKGSAPSPTKGVESQMRIERLKAKWRDYYRALCGVESQMRIERENK